MSNITETKEKHRKHSSISYNIIAKANDYNPVFFIAPPAAIDHKQHPENSLSNVTISKKNSDNEFVGIKLTRSQKLIHGQVPSKTNSNLILSVIDDNLDIFEQIITSNPYLLVQTDFYGITLLMLASNYNSPKITLWLCKRMQVDINSQDYKGNTPLHYAAAEGSEKCVEILICYGAQTAIENYENVTALQLACYHGSTRVLKLMLSACALNVNHKDSSGKTALMLACLKGRISIVLLLLQYGVKTKSFDNNGMSALMYASSTGKIGVCYELLEYDFIHRFISLRHLNNAKRVALRNGHTEISDLIDEYVTKGEQFLSDKSASKNSREITNKNDKVLSNSKAPQENAHKINEIHELDFNHGFDSSIARNTRALNYNTLNHRNICESQNNFCLNNATGIDSTNEGDSNKSKSATAVEHTDEMVTGVPYHMHISANNVNVIPFDNASIHSTVACTALSNISRNVHPTDPLNTRDNRKELRQATRSLVGLGLRLETEPFSNRNIQIGAVRNNSVDKFQPEIVVIDQTNTESLSNDAPNNNNDTSAQNSLLRPTTHFKSRANVSVYSVPKILLDNNNHDLENNTPFIDARESFFTANEMLIPTEAGLQASYLKENTLQLANSDNCGFGSLKGSKNSVNLTNNSKIFLSNLNKKANSVKYNTPRSGIAAMHLEHKHHQSVYSEKPLNNYSKNREFITETNYRLLDKQLKDLNTSASPPSKSNSDSNTPVSATISIKLDDNVKSISSPHESTYNRKNVVYPSPAKTNSSSPERVYDKYYNKLPQLPQPKTSDISLSLQTNWKNLDKGPYIKALPPPPPNQNTKTQLVNVENLARREPGPKLGKLLALKKKIKQNKIKAPTTDYNASGKTDTQENFYDYSDHNHFGEYNNTAEKGDTARSNLISSIQQSRSYSGSPNTCYNSPAYENPGALEYPGKYYKDLPTPQKKYVSSVINRSFFAEPQVKAVIQRKSLPEIPKCDRKSGMFEAGKL